MTSPHIPFAAHSRCLRPSRPELAGLLLLRLPAGPGPWQILGAALARGAAARPRLGPGTCLPLSRLRRAAPVLLLPAAPRALQPRGARLHG